jgi:hypothetical protein
MAIAIDTEPHTLTEEQWNTIEEAVKSEWDIDSSYAYKVSNIREYYGNGTLAGGETEEDFTSRVARAVWKAHGAYVGITVSATDIENAPCEEYIRTTDDYKMYKNQQTEKGD